MIEFNTVSSISQIIPKPPLHNIRDLKVVQQLWSNTQWSREPKVYRKSKKVAQTDSFLSIWWTIVSAATSKIVFLPWWCTLMSRGWHSCMLCTSIFVRGQNLDRKKNLLLYCIDPMAADIFAKILLWPWPKILERYGGLTVDLKENFKLTFDFHFDRRRRSKYTSATPLWCGWNNWCSSKYEESSGATIFSNILLQQRQQQSASSLMGRQWNHPYGIYEVII